MFHGATGGAFAGLNVDSFFVILFIVVVSQPHLPRCLGQPRAVPLSLTEHEDRPRELGAELWFTRFARRPVRLQGLFFFCFVYPWALGALDNFTKFELTDEMQQELKELIEKVLSLASLHALIICDLDRVLVCPPDGPARPHRVGLSPAFRSS